MTMPLTKNQPGKRMWPFSEVSLAWATWWGDVANLVLLVSLLTGVLATFVIVRTTNVKEHHWDEARRQSAERIAKSSERIAALTIQAEGLRKETAEASAEVAKANAAAAAAQKEAAEARLALERLKAPRTLNAERQQRITAAASAFKGQRYRAAVSSSADDGPAFWESLYTALEKAGWVYVPSGPPGVGNPMAGIPIAAAPGVEIRIDPAREAERAPAALALGNALHAIPIVVAVNRDGQSHPEEAMRDVLFVVIGARIPPP